ncbi:MAG: FKBP-type peptidyl-prolyl cis-trans isomerase [Candidatus Dormibacterales bacterium]
MLPAAARTAFLAALLLAAAAATAACGYANPYGSTAPAAGVQTSSSPSPHASATTGGDSFTAGAGVSPVELSDGLEYIDLKVGHGAAAKSGEKISVQYTGWLSNGSSFDSSWSRGQPFTFTVGKGQVIKGWDEGVPGMRVGGKRKLIIPPALGYGSQGQPPTIPANSTLTFEVTLVSIG